MLIKESFEDFPLPAADGGITTMRIFLFHPHIPEYPNARFPGVLLFSEIYQVTGPVARLARQIAGHGYIVAAPSSYHDFTGPEPLAYDVPGTDQGNEWKVKKTLESYDQDSTVTASYLCSLATCTGRLGATGMCLGGHLALRASFDPRITACVAYFPTDIHCRTLGPNSGPQTSSAEPPPSLRVAPPSTFCPDSDRHTLDLLHRLVPPRTYPRNSSSLPHYAPSTPPSSDPTLSSCEVAFIFGVRDTHVPDAGRDLIRAKMRAMGVMFSFHEFAGAQHAFIRDELSKGRYDPAVSGVCFSILMELFGRRLKMDLGEEVKVGEGEHVC